jgi:alginate O-acetyltransferase complex protein AlgI
MSKAMDILKGMAGFNGILLPESYAHKLAFLSTFGISFGQLPESNFRFYHIPILAAIFAFVLLAPNSAHWQQKFKHRPLRWAIPCAVLFLWCLFNLEEMAEFLYYQF